ncbi:AAA family ATPase (plasmid) [Halorientalis pallida]|uniref:AAA family ATPase n=1 Tax=Halorientalis pallida TaxID=2479928 RepID=UPI003C6FD9CC
MSSDLDDDLVTVWAIGENGNWESYRDAGIITLGYKRSCRDLTGVQSMEELKRRVELDFSPAEASPDSNTKSAMLFRFANSVEPGDIVIAKNGTATPKGLGVVASAYQFDPTFPPGGSEDCHYRWVRWMVDLTEGDVDITLSDTQFSQSTEVREKRDTYEEIRDAVEDLEESTDGLLPIEIDQLEKVAESTAARCSDPDAITPEQATVNHLFENYGGGGGAFVDNLEHSVGGPLSEELREELQQIVTDHTVTDSNVLRALRSEQLTAWASPSSNDREYAALRPGDWVVHVCGGGDTTARYLQRIDVVPMNLPKPIREEIGSAIFEGESYDQLFFSTTPVVELDIPNDEFMDQIKAASSVGDDSPYKLDVTGFFQQIRPEVTYQGGGARNLLETALDTWDQQLPANTQKATINTDDMFTPLGLSERSEDTDPVAPTSVSKLDDADTHFILATDSGRYKDEIESHYHFTTSSPGHDQLRTAMESGQVSFVGLRKQDAGWVFDSVGRITDITEEGADDETHFYAATEDVAFIDPVPLEAVNPLIEKGEIRRRPINKIRQADLEMILQWHYGPGVQAAAQLLDREAADRYTEAFAHLVAGRNLIFYGPPGTGKTYTAKQLLEAVCDPPKTNIETANAEWTNYDIVGGWAPGPDSEPGDQSAQERANWHAKEGIISASARDCQNALEQRNRPNWLLIDEINRANLDQAFGDVFTLLDLDYRAQKQLTYADSSQSVPNAFRILATQNTSDLAQLFSLGYAFRRRFAFVEVPSELGSGSTADTSEIELTDVSLEPTGALAAIDSELKMQIEEMATKRLSYAEQTEQSGQTRNNTPAIDPAAIFPQFASPPRIENALTAIKDRSLALEGGDCIETVLSVATAATQRDVVDIGKAIVMDVIAYVLAYELAFPGEADATTVDEGCCAYLVPQFETVMSELRQADALNQDNNTRKSFREVIKLTEELGLDQTAGRLAAALESNRIFG